MALPPTQLTALLYDSGTEPASVHAALVAADCLRSSAAADADPVTEMVAAAKERLQAASNTTGPNLVDILSDMLVAAEMLNERGMAMADTRA